MKHARTFSMNLISTHILLCYLSSISRFLQQTPLYIASEEYCNSLANSKGRRSHLPFHYVSFSNLFPHTTSNPLSSTSCRHASQFPFKSNRIYNMHSLVHSSRSFLSSEWRSTFCLGTKVAGL